MGSWSEPIEFSTGRLPPPSIKTPPRFTEVAHGSYQIEWSSVRIGSTGLNDRMFYRLQTAPGGASSRGGVDRPEDWTTVCLFSFAFNHTHAYFRSIKVRLSRILYRI